LNEDHASNWTKRARRPEGLFFQLKAWYGSISILTNSKESDLNNGLYDISYSCYLLKSLLRREQLKDFTINHKISGTGFRHLVDCPEVEKVRGDILKKCNAVKQAVRWKVHSILTYEGLDKLQRRSQNPSVVTAFEKMIWQREKTVYL
jgi:hypothetical protein